MVMYTHQFGRVSGGLSVLVAEKQIYPVWERGGALGTWGKGWGGVCHQQHIPGTWTQRSTDNITQGRHFLLHCCHKKLSNLWTCPNQILFVAAIRDQAYGGIAIDDIVLSPWVPLIQWYSLVLRLSTLIIHHNCMRACILSVIYKMIQ